MSNRDKLPQHPNNGSSSLANRPNDCLFFVHTGHSMAPILLDQDLLEVSPHNDESIKKGNVIVFYSPDDGTIIAHRVTSVKSGGIVTRGDNNMAEDPWRLPHSAVIGKVMFASNRHGRRNVQRGLRDPIMARWLCSWNKLYHKSVYYIYQICPPISSQKMLPCLVISLFKPKVAVFKAEGDRKILLFFGKRIIGEYNVNKGRWQINKFYSLFIDSAALPNFNKSEIPEKKL
jgi:signal peptidase I